ncbi:MAG: hypothetical protein OEM82_05570, partial [Acidobacteriota bacterium]|nr:hypothetical protein [Acidobacteriota bacterium]
MKRIYSVLFIVALCVQLTAAQEPVDLDIIARIREEGFQRSKIMPAVEHLADVYGPRLTSSPNLKRAQQWAMKQMLEWGLENVALEPWGEFGNGWEVESYSVEMTAPTYDRINAVPLAWSPATQGEINGTPVLVSIRSESDFAKYKGKLAGKIVLNGTAGGFDRFTAPGKRLTKEQLEKASSAIDPSGAGIDGGKSVAYQDEDKDWKEYLAQRWKVIDFLKEEGAAVVIQPSAFPYGVVRTAGYYRFAAEK